MEGDGGEDNRLQVRRLWKGWGEDNRLQVRRLWKVGNHSQPWGGGGEREREIEREREREREREINQSQVRTWPRGSTNHR